MKDTPVSSVDQMMQGKLSGVNVMPDNMPGGGVAVRIRGYSTIRNNDPLYIIDGIPATANKWLLTDLLRNEWGFGGLLVTDYNSIAEMSSHGVAPLKEASIRALQAGTDMDMVSCGFLNTLEESLKEAKVTEEQINMACRRVLEAKYKLGLFSNPYKYCDALRAKEKLYTPFFTTKPVGEGTGLGLSITKSIIEQKHNGTIEMESEPNEFTRFTITIPIK